MKHLNDKLNPKRENTLKVPLNDAEDLKLRQFCAGLGLQVAPFMRQAAFAHMRAANDTAVKPQTKWPRHGHVQRFPGRAAVAGGCRHLRL